MPGILEERMSSRKIQPGTKATMNREGKNGGAGSDVTGKHRMPDRPDKSTDKGLQTDIRKKQSENSKEKEAGAENVSSLRIKALGTEPLSQEDAEFLGDLGDIMSGAEDEKDNAREKLARRIGITVMSILCIYMVMLIYGAATTEYRYNDAGEIEPVVLSVSDMQAKNEFSTLLGMYLQTRSLYETILTLDYRMASGIEDSMGIAPEYEAALDTVSTLAVQIDASNISSRYNQIKSMLLTWIQTHCAAYCQFMSAAITQNDSNAAAEAIAARQVVNDYFQTITMNIVTLGEDIGLFDLTDIKEWSPDTYIQSTYEGLE